MKPIRTVGIAGTGHYLPERILSNHDLEKLVDTSDEWIFTRTGMRERRISAPDQACSDLCLEAAHKALQDANMSPAELDLVVVATVSGDMPFPATGAILQNRLGAHRAAGFDVANACSGFLSALMVVRGMIASGIVSNALVVGAECLSRIVDYTDRGSCILFGDGAGAMVLKAGHPQGEILDNFGGSDGAQWDAIHIPGGGSRRPTTEETVRDRMHYMRLNGNEVFKFAVAKFRDLIHESLDRNGFVTSDIALVVPHQVNIRIIEAAIKKLDLGMDRVYVNLERYGNTSAASVPIAFDEARRAGRIRSGDLISLVAFGAGLSWGSALLRW